MTAASTTEYLSPSQAAQVLGLSARSVNRAADMGKLPVAFRTPGGHRRFTRTAVDTFKAEREGGS